MMKDKGCLLFGWQTGYGAFSVSQSMKQSVIERIAKQENHHRKMTFQDEIRAIMKKHGVRLEERYVWD
jgi:REP-associated tyrosine transposase